MLNMTKLQKNIKKTMRIIILDTVDSTNNEAKRIVTAPITTPLLICAGCQTAGRGRRGHDFYSPADTGLYISLVLPINEDSADIQRITCAAGVAAAEAIERAAGVAAGIKWVNDIYVNGRKVCGILTELLSDTENRPIAVCVGIGVNLTTADFPDEIADIAGCIGGLDRNLLCAEIANRLTDLYAQISDSGFMRAYAERSTVLGKTVTFCDADGEHTAVAVGIADDGGLIVEENSLPRTLHSGEISVKI